MGQHSQLMHLFGLDQRRAITASAVIVLFIGALTSVGVSASDINTFPEKFLTLRAYVEVPSYTVEIDSKVNSGGKVQWVPNLRALTGVDLAIKGLITAGTAWANNDQQGSAGTKGTTDYSDYRVGLTTDSLRAEADYEQFKGFYVGNTNQVNPAYNGYIQDGTMIAGNISVNATYILSPEKFSYVAGFGQSVRQEKSGGSVLLGIAASDVYFHDGNGLIPAVAQSSFGQDASVTDMKFISLTAKIGAGYTLCWTQKWFTTIVGDLGGGAEYRDYTTSSGETQTNGGTSKIDALFSFGYNGDSFLAAMIFTADITQYTTQTLSVPATLGDAKIVVGGHF